MVMENLEKLNASQDAVSHIDRPERYTCYECGREFTKLALIYHKKTCSEKEDCQCIACKISKRETVDPPSLQVEQCSINDANGNVGKKEVPIIAKLEIPIIVPNLNLSTKVNGITIVNLRNKDEACKSMEIRPPTEVKDVSNESNIDISADVVMETNGETSIEDVSMETSVEDVPMEESHIDKQVESKESSQVCAEYREDHDGESCSRKLFCSSCKDHIFWESFGIHILQHCQKLENDYLQCPECPKSFSRPTMLLLHYFIHASTHPLDCAECRCGYSQCIDETTRTVAEHCYAETYHCYICLKVFSHEQSIANHMRLHSKEMPFTCTECNRSFRQVGNLQRHMATHSGNRPHQCPDCERSFADPATLRNHVRVHTGETPYVCTLCKRGFTQVGNLKRHIALHLKNEKTVPPSSEVSSTDNCITLNTGILVEDGKTTIKEEEKTVEFPAVVEAMELNNSKDEIVSSSTNEPSNPSADNQVEEVISNSKSSRGRKRNGKFKIFPCPICNKIYTWKHDLQVHYRTHTGEKPYRCEICDKRFAQSGAVRTHLARHHSGKVKYKRKIAVATN